MIKNVGTRLVSVVLVLTLVPALAACGGPKTLEEYFAVDENKQTLEEIRQKAGSMTTYGDSSVEVEGNNIKCTVKLNKAFDDNPFASGVFEESDTTELAKSVAELEDKMHLSGCSLEYVFRDANDLVLYQAKVDRNGLVQVGAV